MAAKKVKYVIYGGNKYKLLNETGKYYLCEKGMTIRKLRPDIKVIEVEKETRKDQVREDREGEK